MLSFILSFVLALGGHLQTHDEFARYPAEPLLATAPIQPKMTSPKARRFRTVLTEEAARGANFNGHYRVVHWGCGTNCAEWAVINLKTGAVWFAPEPAMSCWSSAGDADAATPPPWFEMRLDSRLLRLYECNSRGGGGRVWDSLQVYVWNGSAMKFLRSEPLGK